MEFNSTAPLRDEFGVIVGLMAIVADISERKRMDQALRESLQKSRRIFDETIHALAGCPDHPTAPRTDGRHRLPVGTAGRGYTSRGKNFDRG